MRVMLQVFGYLSALLSVAMVVPYIRDIFRGTTRPERASWFIWTVLGFIAFFSQLAEGASHSLWLTAGQTLAVFSVFVLSVKYGYGGLGSRDRKALAGAGVGLVLWYLTSHAYLALFLVIVVDSFGTVLTVLKAYEDPASETMSTWILSGTSGIFGMLAVGRPDPVLLAYPFYIVCANFSVVVAMILGSRRRVL